MSTIPVSSIRAAPRSAARDRRDRIRAGVVIWLLAAAATIPLCAIPGCSVLAGGAAGAATGYVAGHEAGKDAANK